MENLKNGLEECKDKQIQTCTENSEKNVTMCTLEQIKKCLNKMLERIHVNSVKIIQNTNSGFYKGERTWDNVIKNTDTIRRFTEQKYKGNIKQRKKRRLHQIST